MKKIYDIKSGHYVYAVNEDESSEQSNNDSQAADKAAEAAEKQHELNAQTQEKISKLDTEKSLYVKKYQQTKSSIESQYGTSISTQQGLMATANAAVASAVDSAEKAKATSQVLDIRKKIAEIELKKAQDIQKTELEYAQNLYKIEIAKIQILADANASTVAEKWDRIPEKYRNVLNESNIHLAKIYLKTLVNNDDEDSIMKDMRDVIRVFKDSQLVYGKDKTGHYVICIDQDDFNKLYATLQNAGYMRDDIFAVVMPQVLDRSSMIDSTQNQTTI